MRDQPQHPTSPPSTSSSPPRRRLRALGQAVGVAGVAAVLLAGLGVRPAQAHVPIVLLVLAPKDGQRVTADPEVIIYAQRMLGGVNQVAVAYTLTLDQHPIDPASGRTASSPRSGQIRAGQQVRVALRDLSTGNHRLALRYRPDRDAPVMGTTVAFTVRAAASSLPMVPVGVGLGLAAAAGAAAWWTRRRILGAAR